MSRIADIEFEAGGLKFALSPLKQKQAGRVFHTCVAQLVSAFSGAIGAEGQEQQIAGVAKALALVDYDVVWDLAEILCKGAFVNEKELKNLEELDALSDEPWLLYQIIFNGVKGNWPRVFSGLEAKLGGFASRIQDQMKTATGV